jgi:hypothetical protein
MRRVASAIAIAAFLAAGPVHAFEAAGADIIGLRLGMSESDVAAELASQGYAMNLSQGVVSSETKDGRLRVMLSSQRKVVEIVYVFYGRGVGGPARVRDAITTRFGDPNQATPPTWCRAVGRDGVCPAGQATLTFLPDSLTMRLMVAQDRAR